MNKPTNNIKATHKTNKPPRDPRRSREPLVVEDLGNYTSNHQVDPWRGQFMQLSWDYCV